MSDEIKSSYAWLYDYTNDCVAAGCNSEDNNQYPTPTLDSSNQGVIYGYWTSTASTSNEYFASWMVMNGGFIYDESVTAPTIGVRPVITLSKSIFE